MPSKRPSKLGSGNGSKTAGQKTVPVAEERPKAKRLLRREQGNGCMRGSRKFCQKYRKGSNFDNVFFVVFLVDEGWDDRNTTLSGLSSARQRNSMAFRWRADDGPTLNAGSVAS